MINSRLIVVHLLRFHEGIVQCLLLKRLSQPHDNWQMISGKVEEGESYFQAARREVLEETGLVPDRIYSADWVETFYLPQKDKVYLAPVFVAFLDSPQPVKISEEHSAYRWFYFQEAIEEALEFSGQRRALAHIEDWYITRQPNPRFLLS